MVHRLFSSKPLSTVPRHAFAFFGSFHGMRPSTEAIMQVSLTPA